ncbi:hypothetical protein [Candidatus Ichthyocystis hellenicum]|uniref:hypothetical protein n=1 Tax=Candidatus Ichthyocystis hellenicum TaxID=1561003 RepID=UPI000B871C3C|nr:hypothetical protein [Candidatus Ichthyocystis hellenicum]
MDFTATGGLLTYLQPLDCEDDGFLCPDDVTESESGTAGAADTERSALVGNFDLSNVNLESSCSCGLSLRDFLIILTLILSIVMVVAIFVLSLIYSMGML